MLRPLARSLLLASLCAAGAAHAGTVYVPLPGLGSVGGSTYEAQVSISNTAAAAGAVSEALLATDTDGTQRPDPPSSLTVQPGQTAVVTAGSTFRGLVELAGGAGVRYSARLAGSGPGRLGVYLPVITSDNLIPGGQTATVQGLVSGSGRRADLTMVNLAATASQCTGSLYLADGTLLAGPATFDLKPLSSTALTDLFAGGGAADVRLTMSCTQSFFTYVLLADDATGEVTYLGPAGNGASGIGGTPTPPAGCPSGATCFDAKGVVFQPTPDHRVQRVMFAAPPGVASRLRMSLDVTVGPWYPVDPSGKTLIYWFVVDRNFDMAGLLYFRGPDPAHPHLAQNQIIARHGFELTHPQKLTLMKPFAAVIGHTYHCDNDYDMGRGVYTVTITDTATGQVAVQLVGAPNVSSWTLKAKDNFLIDMGFPGTNTDEVPTDGWTYSNVHLEVYE
ncbi:MAG TPA: hypothetical protein VIE43_25125 [Thermoanaerobaculia bacterium]|nr:hypothetical protein [Thermoanaerobaculia bacterium]